MNTLVLLAAGLVACPWTHSVRYTYCEPTVIYMPCTPTYVTCTPAPAPVTRPVAQVQAETQQEVVAENVSHEEEDPIANVAAEDEEIVTEPAAFTSASSLNLGHMALDWGVATIGAGTLMPTTGILGIGGVGFPGGGYGGGSYASDDVQPYIPSIVNQITIINNGIVDPGDPTPVPEPATILVWLACGLFLAGWLRRQKSPQVLPIRAEEDRSPTNR